MNVLDIFGNNLKSFRLKNKLSQLKLSELSGIHWTYISQVENGKKNISLIKINNLANALNVSVVELLKGIK